MPNVSSLRRRARTKPDAHIRFDEREREVLDRLCASYRADMTTFLRTVVMLIDNGTIKVPSTAFDVR